MVTVNVEQLEDLAKRALINGEEEAALGRLLPVAKVAESARLWQFTGLLQRSLDQHSDALNSFKAASKLAPDDAGIANGLARVALEAGLDAVALFERAGQLAPSNGGVLLGLVAAKLATGRGAEAEILLDSLVNRSPLWIEGHQQLAQLRSMLGKRDQSAASLERAIASQPKEHNLWVALLNLILTQNAFAALDQVIERARQAGLPPSDLLPFEAIAAAEGGKSEHANALFGQLPPKIRQDIAVWDARHLLRTGRIEEAIRLIDRELEGERALQFWPYASIAWRLTQDPRHDWLERGSEFVSTFDLTDRLPPLDRLADVLRDLHVAPGEYLDQSVRGGTQTDGPLFSRIDPDTQTLRSTIIDAVEEYRAQLPPFDRGHPLLKHRRDVRIRFSGSWSVRLRNSGFHTNHVHPQGWISSALYVALPPRSLDNNRHAGWLKLGEPPAELGLNLLPTKMIEPRPGRLVLFPSWMWHGTVPYSAGERLTIAFDIRPPGEEAYS